MSLFERREFNMMKWVSFWRKNPHRFVQDYLGVKLFFFQKILIYMLNKNPYFMYIASRGQGKSYLIAIYAVARCILYPGTKIVIASGVKNQARLIISEKITDLYNRSPALRAEIGDYKEHVKTGVNSPEVIFLNGSKISAVPSSDNSRGLRGNILICDEFRLITYDVVSTVLKPMLTVPRIPEFKSKHPKKYKAYDEPNIEIYISSAFYKTNWIWDEFQSYLDKMLRGKNVFIADIPYQAAILHGILKQERVDMERSSDLFDENGFRMEYEALFVGENDKGYFKLDPINRSRQINKVFIPPTELEYIENQRLSKPKKLSNMPRQTGEIRITSLDVALQAGSKAVKNDTAAFTCLRMIPDKNGSYRRDVVYLETIRDNIETTSLAIRLKQLYYDFESDYAVLDAAGNGLGVYDACASILSDEERDCEYEAWTSINDEELQERFKNNNGKPVLYTYKGAAKINSDIAVSLKTAFGNGKLRLPVTDILKREDILTNDKARFKALSLEDQQRELATYQQASALVSELVGLEYTIGEGGNIRIKEVGSATKDRYSSLAYANHRAQEIEREKNSENESSDYGDYIFIGNWR